MTMRVDLSIYLEECRANLLKWRLRYPSSIYPEKVLLNMFYRKYAMNFLWPELLECFRDELFGGSGQIWDNWVHGYNQLRHRHKVLALNLVLPFLEEWYADEPDKRAGGVAPGDYAERIARASAGIAGDLEEIEYAYTYYFLTDEAILIWASIGGTGKGKIEVIGEMSGAIIETPEISDYDHAEYVLGRLCVAPFLQGTYKALPPLHK